MPYPFDPYLLPGLPSQIPDLETPIDPTRPVPGLPPPPKLPDWSNWTPPQDRESATPAPVSTPGLLSDAGNLLKRGYASTAQGVNWLAGKIPGLNDLIDAQSGQDYWSQVAKEAGAALSPQQQAASEKKFINDDYSLGPAWSDPRSYLGSVLESVPGTVAGMAIGGPLTAAARGVAGAVLPKVSEKALTMGAGALGYGAGEGLVSAGTDAIQARDLVMSNPDLARKGPLYQQVKAQGMTDDQALAHVADTVASQVGTRAGVTVGLLGAPMGALFGRWFHGGGGKLAKSALGELGVGALGEGAQEFAQSGPEQLYQNQAIQQHVNPSQNLWEDVLNQSVSGAISGALMGIGMGGGGHAKGHFDQSNVRADEAARATADLRANLEFAREQDIAEALAGFDKIEAQGSLPKSAAERLNAARQQLSAELALRATPDALAAPIDSARGEAGYLGLSARPHELSDDQIAEAAQRPLPDDAPDTWRAARDAYGAEAKRRQDLTLAAAHFERNPDAIQGVARVLDDIAAGKPLSEGSHGSTDYNLASLSDDMLTRYRLAGEVLLRDHADALGKSKAKVEKSFDLLNAEADRRANGQRGDPQAIREADIAQRIAKGSKSAGKLLDGLSPDAMERMADGLESRVQLEPNLAATAIQIRQRAQQERLRLFNPQGAQQPGMQAQMKGWNRAAAETAQPPAPIPQNLPSVQSDQDAQRRAALELAGRSGIAPGYRETAGNRQQAMLPTPSALPAPPIPRAPPAASLPALPVQPSLGIPQGAPRRPILPSFNPLGDNANAQENAPAGNGPALQNGRGIGPEIGSRESGRRGGSGRTSQVRQQENAGLGGQGTQGEVAIPTIRTPEHAEQNRVAPTQNAPVELPAGPERAGGARAKNAGSGQTGAPANAETVRSDQGQAGQERQKGQPGLQRGAIQSGRDLRGIGENRHAAQPASQEPASEVAPTVPATAPVIQPKPESQHAQRNQEGKAQASPLLNEEKANGVAATSTKSEVRSPSAVADGSSRPKTALNDRPLQGPSPAENKVAPPKPGERYPHVAEDSDSFSLWREVETGRREPDPHQRRLMDSVGRALEAGHEYNRAIDEFVAKDLGDYLPPNRENGVEGGVNGYEIYKARHAVEAERERHANAEAVKGFKVGDTFKNLSFRHQRKDYRLLNAEITAIDEKSGSVTLKGTTAGRKGHIEATISALGVKRMVEAAQRKAEANPPAPNKTPVKQRKVEESASSKAKKLAPTWNAATVAERMAILKATGASDDFAKRKAAEWQTWDQIPEGPIKKRIRDAMAGKEEPTAPVPAVKETETPTVPAPPHPETKTDDRTVRSGKNDQGAGRSGLQPGSGKAESVGYGSTVQRPLFGQPQPIENLISAGLAQPVESVEGLLAHSEEPSSVEGNAPVDRIEIDLETVQAHLDAMDAALGATLPGVEDRPRLEPDLSVVPNDRSENDDDLPGGSWRVTLGRNPALSVRIDPVEIDETETPIAAPPGVPLVYGQTTNGQGFAADISLYSVNGGETLFGLVDAIEQANAILKTRADALSEKQSAQGEKAETLLDSYFDRPGQKPVYAIKTPDGQIITFSQSRREMERRIENNAEISAYTGATVERITEKSWQARKIAPSVPDELPSLAETPTWAKDAATLIESQQKAYDAALPKYQKAVVDLDEMQTQRRGKHRGSKEAARLDREIRELGQERDRNEKTITDYELAALALDESFPEWKRVVAAVRLSGDTHQGTGRYVRVLDQWPDALRKKLAALAKAANGGKAIEPEALSAIAQRFLGPATVPGFDFARSTMRESWEANEFDRSVREIVRKLEFGPVAETRGRERIRKFMVDPLDNDIRALLNEVDLWLNRAANDPTVTRASFEADMDALVERAEAIQKEREAEAKRKARQEAREAEQRQAEMSDLIRRWETLPDKRKDADGNPIWIEYPKEVGPVNVAPVPDKIKKSDSAVKALSPSVAVGDVRYYINAVHADENNIAATDGHQLVVIPNAGKTPAGFYDPNTGALKPEAADWKFPDYSKVTPDDQTAKGVTEGVSLDDLIARVNGANRARSFIRDKFTRKGAATFAIRLADASGSAYFNPAVLLRALSSLKASTGAETVMVRTFGDNNVIKVSVPGTGAHAVIMPIRMVDKPTTETHVPVDLRAMAGEGKVKAEPDAAQNIRQSRPSASVQSATVAQARAQLTTVLGERNVSAMERAGKLVFHKSDPTGTGAAGYVDRDGAIHLIPGNMDQTALDVALHEGMHLAKDDRFAEGERAKMQLAHATLKLVGLKNLVGNPGFTDLVQQVHRMAAEGNQVAQEALNKARLEGRADSRVDVAEETVAYLAQYADPKLPLVRRVLAAIRAALYRMGIKIDLTPADVRALALSALKARAKAERARLGRIERLEKLEDAYAKKHGHESVRMRRIELLRQMPESATLADFERLQERALRASLPATENDAAEQARLWEEFQAVRAQFQARQPEETAFKRWFGKGMEGVTARDGKPITLYHGTDSPEFNRWDETRSGKVSNHPTSGLGFFMTADRRAAARYGSRLLELNAKIDRPYYLTDADLSGIESVRDATRLRRKLLAQGYDGAVVSAPGSSPYVIAFESRQIKRTDNANPTDSEDFRYSRPGQREKTAPPEETRAQAIQRAIQDRFVRFQTVQKWIKDSGIDLTPEADVYGAEALLPKKTAARTEDARDKTLKPLVESAAGRGWSIGGGKLIEAIAAGETMPVRFQPSIGEYLHALHAPERNAQIAKVNPAFPDGGSGLTDSQAADILARYRARSDFADFAGLAARFQAITRQTRAILLDAGIISQDAAKAWDSAYRHYIPLKGGPEDVAQKTGTGPGISVGGKQHRALGHDLRDERIVENIWRDHERAIYLSEKQVVARALKQLLIQSDNEAIGTVGKPEKRAVLHRGWYHQVWIDGAPLGAYSSYSDAKAAIAADSQTTGRPAARYGVRHQSADPAVVYMSKPLLGDNEVALYEGGSLTRMQLNDDLLARAAKNLGVDAAGGLLKAGQSFNRYLSKAYTGYNPEFILSNIARDFTTGFINLTGKYGAGFARKAILNYPAAVKGLWNHIHGRPDALVDRYRAAGGSTGAAYLSDLERIGTDIERVFQDFQGARATWAAGQRVGAARVASYDALRAVGGWIEKINQIGENALRVATFKAMLDAHHDERDAARAAGDVTVNFNRKGEMAATLGGLYLFFNPSVQGTKVMMDALTRGPHRGQAAALSGGLALLALTLAELARGGDDDREKRWKRIAGYTKDHNLIVAVGDKQLTLPVPYGYGAFWSLGNILSDLAHGEDKTKAGIRLASTLFEQFSPVGNPLSGDEIDAKNIVSLLPTALKPPVSMALNRNELGRPLMPEATPWNVAQPDSARKWRSTTGSVYDRIATSLNALTGGNAYQAGAVDVSPESLKYIWRTLTGGAGQFAADTLNLGIALAQGAGGETEPREWPVARRFLRAESIQDARSLFGEQSREVRLAVDAFAAAKRARDLPAMREIAAENREMLALGKTLESIRTAVAARRQAEDAISRSGESLAERRRLLREVELQEETIYSRFFDLFEGAKKRKAG